MIAAVNALGPKGDGDDARTLNGGQIQALTVKLDQAGRLLSPESTDGTNTAEALLVLAGYEQQLADFAAEGVLTETQAAALSAGRHTSFFDGGRLASGIYLVRMTTSTGYTQTRRLTLVR